ncbi:hypothetical protein MKZ38_000293 [Zalerion maritima]|uniref:DUF7719 domain-containing protein n=1 Tax=Zalerion maritima TaxID=339359 RepID=A0AAD5RSZ5_9PEZI|nr:hypothetical protein MKZ38_000293 [Zalerion maritima]
MAKKDKSSRAPNIKLAQPDRSGPTDQTLLDLAQEQDLFGQADKAQARSRRKAAKKDARGPLELEGDEEEEKVDPEVDHLMDTFFWGISLAMLHFTLDVLVQHQYAMEIEWMKVIRSFGGAILCVFPPSSAIFGCGWNTSNSKVFPLFQVFMFLVFILHNHPGNKFLFGVPPRLQSPIRQAIFFATSTYCGCYLIYVTNREGYMRVMKQAPSLGCLWVWAVIEMNLGLAVVSLGIDALFMWWAGLGLM